MVKIATPGYTFFISVHLLLLCMGLMPSTLVAAMDDSATPGQYVEKTLSGNFLDAQHATRLILRRQTRPDDPDLLLLYRVADDGSQKELSAPTEALNSYAYSTFIELCRDPDTGLDQLLFAQSPGGTANGDEKNALFVYYDQQDAVFTTADIDAQFVDDSCSLAQAEERASQRVDYSEMIDVLKPPEADKHQLRSKALPGFTLKQMRHIMAQANSMEKHAAWEGSGDLIQPSEFHIDKLAKNSLWRIVTVYYAGPGDLSSGVVLAQNRKTAAWRSIYTIPEGGSKVALYLPYDAKLQGNHLQLNLCTDCSWWGTYAPFLIKLDSLDYRQLPMHPQ